VLSKIVELPCWTIICPWQNPVVNPQNEIVTVNNTAWMNLLFIVIYFKLVWWVNLNNLLSQKI
jgi:hypothetical protein